MNNTDTNSNKELKIKGSEKILSIFRNFTYTEKVIFSFFSIVLVMSTIAFGSYLNNMFLVSVPTYGGEMREAIIGLPHSINPVLAFTDTDRDLNTLIYSGLTKYKDGKIIPDIAESFNISDDGLVYTFKIKRNVKFHDGVTLTAKDVEFTIKKIQDVNIKNPRKADWANITVKVINDYEIQFILKQIYTPFITNTTIGILPEHIWSKIESPQFVFSQNNLEPIGSGPYKISKINKDSEGIPKSYEFEAWNKYHNGKPYISSLKVFFYPNEKEAIDAYKKGTVENIAGISPKNASVISNGDSNANILHFPLPRVFGIFFNQNQSPIFSYPEVREALNISLDRKYIIERVLYSYGVEIDSPIPKDGSIISNSSKKIKTNFDQEKAKEILTKAGWKLNDKGIMEKKEGKNTRLLEFSISTSDTTDLKDTAEIVKSQWESIGAKVNIKIFEYGDLYQNVISARKYDTLLFGQFIGKDLDLYAFWHSSQRNAPGLNIAMYVNSRVDSILEEARSNFDKKEKDKLYSQFEDTLKRDVPAVFIYSPELVYIIPKKIKGVQIEDISIVSDRFYNIEKWYINTEYIWKIFVRNK